MGHLWSLSPALLLCTSQGSLAVTPLLLQTAPYSALSLVSWQYILQNLNASHSSLYFLDLLLVLEHCKIGTAVPQQWKRRIPCPNPGSVPGHQEAFLAVKGLFTHNSGPTRSPHALICDYWQPGCITALGNPKSDAGLLLSCLCEVYFYRILREILLS